MAFLKGERETVLNYDPETKQWYGWTSYPPHITRFRKKGWIEKKVWSENGREICANFSAPANAVMFKSLLDAKNPSGVTENEDEQAEDE
jgi:hypothetical protein